MPRAACDLSTAAAFESQVSVHDRLERRGRDAAGAGNRRATRLDCAAMRLDVLLHELRIFKSRSQASAAIEAGRVLVAGAPAKASRAMRPGDRVTLLGTRGARDFEVLELPARSLRKEDARRLIRE